VKGTMAIVPKGHPYHPVMSPSDFDLFLKVESLQSKQFCGLVEVMLGVLLSVVDIRISLLMVAFGFQRFGTCCIK
jgi:hypothetical protein